MTSEINTNQEVSGIQCYMYTTNLRDPTMDGRILLSTFLGGHLASNGASTQTRAMTQARAFPVKHIKEGESR